MGSASIGWIDITIVLLYLVFIIWWGLRHGKSSDAGSYFLAGRSMPWWVVGLSLFAASISSTTLIGQCGDAYDTGIAVFNYNLTGVVVMVFFAVFLLPLYIKSKIFTIPEFLQKRFDKRSRYFFSAICIISFLRPSIPITSSNVTPVLWTILKVLGLMNFLNATMIRPKKKM